MEILNTYLRQDQVRLNLKDTLLVVEMPRWLSLLCLILGKNILFGMMVFLEVQEINLQSNMLRSKCGEYFIFL